MGKRELVVISAKEAQARKSFAPESGQVPVQTAIRETMRTRRGITYSGSGLVVRAVDNPGGVKVRMFYFVKGAAADVQTKKE